jgi:CBS domain-containing protein
MESGVRDTTAAGERSVALSVDSLMRPGVEPVDPADRLAVAAARMRAARVGALAVVAAGRLEGLLTERDLVRAVADGLSTDVTAVALYMRPVPGVIGPAASAAAAAARMVELRTRHLPVVSGDRIVGLVSASDLLAAWGVPPGLFGDEPP